MPSNVADRNLVLELREGKLEAMDHLYTAYRTAIFGFLLRLAKDRPLAEDLFQNTWIKVAKNASRLREDTDLRAWLFTVARNEFRSYRRWQVVDLSQLFLLTVEMSSRASHDPGAAHQSPGLDALETALAALATSDREVLLLVCVEGMPREKAAIVLGISDSTLRQRIARARARLKDELTKLGAEPPLARQERAR